ncbi:alpha-2-macroglobulin [Gilliamella apis]|nr:alpha-2-macroglobulin [Gilliamella apis]
MLFTFSVVTGNPLIDLLGSNIPELAKPTVGWRS